MNSMTGYGKGVSVADGYELTIELKSVNNRFLEVNNRITKSLVVMDTAVRTRIGEVLRRGSVEVYYNLRSTSETKFAITADEVVARRYIAIAEQLASLGVPNDLSASVLMRMSEVIRQDETEFSDETKAKLVMPALDAALVELQAARAREGAVLARDLGIVLDSIRAKLAVIRERAPAILADYNARLKDKLTAVLDTVPLDEARLATEVAVYADRVDTNEEIQRLGAHIDAFAALIAAEGETGRKLDFLTQEMTRETNTLGSKCSDLATTNLVLEIKNEIEKLKEQSRNAE